MSIRFGRYLTVLVGLVGLVCVSSACGPSGGGGKDGGAGADGDVTGDASTVSDAGPAVCGNGIVEVGEACDDGNLLSGDGCNATCTLADALDGVVHVTSAGDQREPALACDADGAVVAYTDWGAPLDGAPGAAIRVRLLGVDGQPQVSHTGDDEEFIAHGSLGGDQSQPRVARLSGGGFVVVWKDESGTDPNVRGRVFASDGAQVGSDFMLPASQTGQQETPALAVTPSGGFLAVWVSDGPGPDLQGYSVRGRLFDSTGTPVVNLQTGDTGDFQINGLVAGHQIHPAVAWLGDRYLVVWADGSGSLDVSGYGVVGSLLDDQGGAVGTPGEFLINTTTAGNQATPRLAAQPGLGALVVWTDDSRSSDPEFQAVRGRLLDVDGIGRINGVSLDDGDFAINTTILAGQQLPVASSLADGTLLVAWHDWSAEDGSGAGIRARMFTAAGAPIVQPWAPAGDDYGVNTTWQEDQLTATLCAAGDWFMAAWEDRSARDPDPSGSAVRYRVLVTEP